ncbi:uncharacterized protein LOC127806230 isoform X2 [Diospyros lotus]|uniref:uncharacterized protein LOC127806230 isoform X2 n=1 Tax=Diospyros lotus TaxID=55363 RepID=UPI002258C191|nr:uncharacterized protein LOC127806230 isoform X2 [Diospyros lotus]
MLVANSFDLWQKDTFFSAAEEVQQSADIMESAYRRWEREKREGTTPEGLHELSRELQIALGTAKWQLEEFEKAVSQSYRNRVDDVTLARHRQFVDAIGNQIFHVEAALWDSFSDRGQPLRWVNLNEEECDDLAAFLSGNPGTSETIKSEGAMLGAFTDSSLQNMEEGCHRTKAICINDIQHHTTLSNHFRASNEDAKYVIDIEMTEIPGSRDDINCPADRKSGTRRTWSSPDIDALKILNGNEDEPRTALIPSIEATLKDKGPKPVFWRQRSGDHPEAKIGILSRLQLRRIRWVNQILGQGGCQRQLQTPRHLKLNSVQFKIALMLTIFLIVPFVLYST